MFFTFLKATFFQSGIYAKHCLSNVIYAIKQEITLYKLKYAFGFQE